MKSRTAGLLSATGAQATPASLGATPVTGR
jgi:hypothetical protein